MKYPREAYLKPSGVKVGDIVYIAEFRAINGKREACSIELVVHAVDADGNVTVRNSHRPDEAFYRTLDGQPNEWTPSYMALYKSDKDALNALYFAAEHGQV